MEDDCDATIGLEEKDNNIYWKQNICPSNDLLLITGNNDEVLKEAQAKGYAERNPEADATEIIEVTQEELTRASLQKTPQEVLAIFGQPSYEMQPEVISDHLCLALDDVQDPGNLGTIIRLADWFGIEHIFCSQGTVDVYNPKTIQATMGALARVKLHYCHLPSLIASLRDVPVYGTFLDGENMYGKALSAHGLIVMGNEGNGIGEEVAKLVNERLYIPNYPPQRETSESLNVAVATAIICAEFRRRL